MSNLVERIRGACDGHPHAKIEWPHRILHEAADRIEALEKINIDWAKGNLVHVKECHKYQDRIEALEAALRDTARQKTTDEMDEERAEEADFEGAYDFFIRAARAALAPEQDR